MFVLNSGIPDLPQSPYSGKNSDGGISGFLVNLLQLKIDITPEPVMALT